MLTLVFILIIIACVLLTLVVLIQNITTLHILMLEICFPTQTYNMMQEETLALHTLTLAQWLLTQME
jgi:hypothetical protein